MDFKISDREARLQAELALTPFYNTERYIRHNGFYCVVEQINKEVVSSLQKERRGDKKEFYIKGIDTGARSSFRKRMNNEFQRVIVSEIVSQTEHALNGRQGYKSGSTDTTPNYHTAASEVSPVDHPEHCASGFGNNPEQALIAREALRAQQEVIEEVNAAVLKLKEVGRLGPQYCKTGLFYLKECPEFVAKEKEMELLREYLGLGDNEKHCRLASSLKFRTKKLLLNSIDNPKAQLYVEHIFYREEVSNVKELSNKDILKLWGKLTKEEKAKEREELWARIAKLSARERETQPWRSIIEELQLEDNGSHWRPVLKEISQVEKERMEAEHNALMAEAKSQGYFGCYRPGKCPAPEFCPCTRDTKILCKACRDHLTSDQVIGHPEIIKVQSTKARGGATSKKRRNSGKLPCIKAA